jgi:cell division protein FtsL
MPLKIDWHEDGYVPDENEKKDSLDKYNEEMARDAVGSLFDSEPGEGEDEPPVVTGFDKGAKKAAPSRAPYKPAGTGRERAPAPRVPEVADDRDAPRKRDRTLEPNPTPRPAVRVPVREKRPARTAVSRYDVDEDIDTEVGVEDEMEAFRSRYSKTPKKSEPPVSTNRNTSFRPTNMRFSAVEERDEDEKVPILHWVFIAVTVLLLVTAVYFAYNSYTLGGQLAEANARIEELTLNNTDSNEASIKIETLESQVKTQTDEIARLESIIAGNQTTPEPTFGPDTTPDDPGLVNPSPEDGQGTAAEQTGNKTHTVLKGETLSKISGLYYGNSTDVTLHQKIRDANGITGDNISEGQVLIIPPK